MSRKRTATIQRKTRETAIRAQVVLEGRGAGAVRTGIPFLDHMLELLAKHGLFDLTVRARGDLDVDLHHTNEDLGLALGAAFRTALGAKRGIRRVGAAFVPMDESLARVRVVVDVSGRPHCRWDWHAGPRRPPPAAGRVPYSVEDARHFLDSFVTASGLTVHVDVLKAGLDTHHVLEAVFKALGRALRQAVERDPRVKGVPSTKGRL